MVPRLRLLKSELFHCSAAELGRLLDEPKSDSSTNVLVLTMYLYFCLASSIGCCVKVWLEDKLCVLEERYFADSGLLLRFEGVIGSWVKLWLMLSWYLARVELQGSWRTGRSFLAPGGFGGVVLVAEKGLVLVSSLVAMSRSRFQKLGHR